jgi:hypothetical protein
LTDQEDDYSRQLRKTHVDILLSEARAKQEQETVQEIHRLSYASDAELPTEESVRQSMGLLAEKQASQANPELAKMQRDLDQVERGIVELHQDTERRLYREHPGLLEERVRARMGLPEARQSDQNNNHETPTLEDALRQQMGLKKVVQE